MEAFSIQDATLADCPQCAELLVMQLAEHDVHVTAERLIPTLGKVIADPRYGFLLVALDGCRVVGLAYAATLLSAEHCGFVSSLEELYVIPGWREKGVGTALLTAVFDRATSAGMTAIELEVDVGHSRVMSLYQRFGFRRLERSRWLINLPARK